MVPSGMVAPSTPNRKSIPLASEDVVAKRVYMLGSHATDWRDAIYPIVMGFPAVLAYVLIS